MHLGVFSYNVEYGARPDELARAAEDRGFESFWVGEHTHIPAARQTPYPGGEPLPKPYYHMADPFVSLMAAAAATRTIKLGTGICLVVEHDPIVLAKAVATLDWLSRGRVLFGIGGGWNREEMEHHGTPFAARWRVLRERVLAMKALWTQEEASFHGEFVNFDRAISFPKPVQTPHPPILFGGATAQGRARVVEYCDGWIPIDVLLDDLPAAIADLRQKAQAAGRRPDELSVSVFAFKPPTPDAVRRMEDLGVERVTMVAPRRLDDALPFLDRMATLAAEMPELDARAIDAYWGRENLAEAILAALTARGADLDALTPDVLAPVDQFHGGGKPATDRLARLAAAAPGMQVLDVGGGFGGPARTLAVEFGCLVTTVDLTASYVRAAQALTARMRLDDRVSHHVGNALAAPLPRRDVRPGVDPEQRHEHRGQGTPLRGLPPGAAPRRSAGAAGADGRPGAAPALPGDVGARRLHELPAHAGRDAGGDRGCRLPRSAPGTT